MNNLSFGILLIRLVTGVALLAHSVYLKVFVFTMAGTSQFFESIGLPGPLAWLVMFVEAFTGVMIVVGFKTRIAAVVAIPVLIGATFAHVKNGWLFSNAGGGWEYPVFWTLTLAALALMGNGAYAVSADSQKT